MSIVYGVTLTRPVSSRPSDTDSRTSANFPFRGSHPGRVSAGGGAVLYDPRTHPHHHVVCTRCGAVADIDAPLDDEAVLRAARDAGFEPERADTVVHAVCAACRS